MTAGGRGSRSGVVRIDRRVDEDLVRAGCIRIEAGGERAIHRADELVHHPFGAGQPRRAVVAEQQRLVDERQVAVDDRDRAAPCRATPALRARTPGGRRRTRPVRPGPDASARSREPDGCGRAGPAPRRRRRATPPPRQAEADRAAWSSPFASSSRYAGERLLLARQRPVLAVERPGPHAGQQRALPRHAAVAVVGRVQVDQAVGRLLEAVRRERARGR